MKQSTVRRNGLRRLKYALDKHKIVIFTTRINGRFTNNWRIGRPKAYTFNTIRNKESVIIYNTYDWNVVLDDIIWNTFKIYKV